MSEAQQHDQDKVNRETEHPSDTQQQAGNHDMDIGSMIQEAQEKGVKGALLSRLKKAKVGKVNLDPAIGEAHIPYLWNCADHQDQQESRDGPPALKSHATMDEEGMINVWVDLQKQLASMTHGQDDVKDIKERSIDHEGYDKCPPLNIVIFIVGSRGE